jgi:hypothetical protein
VKGDLAALKRTTDRLDQLVRGGRSRPPSPIANSDLPPHPYIQKSEDDHNQQAGPYYSGYGVNGNLHPDQLQYGMPTPPPSTSPPITGLPPLARNVIPRPAQAYQATNLSSAPYSRSESPLSGRDHALHEMNSPISPSSETSSMQDTRRGSTVNRFGMGYSPGGTYSAHGGVRLEEEASPRRQQGKIFSEA